MERFTISKSEKQTIYEIYRACRLCGAGGGYRMPIIQNIIDLDSSEVELRQKIQECLQLEVRPDDRMPPLICELCVDKLNDFYEFLERARQTNVKTRTRLGLPIETAKKGEAEPNDCILGVTEPIHAKEDEAAKKGKAVPKSSKNIKKEPAPVKVKTENTSDTSRSSSVSSRTDRSSRSTRRAPSPRARRSLPAPAPAPATAPSPATATAPAPAPARRKPDNQRSKAEKAPEISRNTEAPKEKQTGMMKELQTLLEDNMKFDDLLTSRALKRTREEPPRPSLLPKRAKAVPQKEPVKQVIKEPVKEPLPVRSRPGPKSRKPIRHEPEPENAPAPVKVTRAKKTDTPAKAIDPPKPQPEPSPPTATGPPYKCMICDAQIKSSGAFTNHMKSHVPTFTKFTNACNPCGKWFATGEEAATHHRYHRATTFPYHCRRCFDDFRTLQLYDEHIDKGLCVQDEPPQVKCDECWAVFLSEPARAAHKCPGRSGRPGGKCSKCSRTYATVKTLKRHESQCGQRKAGDLIADPDVLRRLKPMRVRITRCDDLFRRVKGDHYDVSRVKPNYGLAKNYIYPYMKLPPVKTEPLKRGNIAIPVALKGDVTDYTHWDSDDSDSGIIRKVPSLSTLAIKKLFSKNVLGKLPRKRKKVKHGGFENDDSNDARDDINDIINSLGDDLGNANVDRNGWTAKIKDIIGCLDTEVNADKMEEDSKIEDETTADERKDDKVSNDTESDESTKGNLAESNERVDNDNCEESSNVEATASDEPSRGEATLSEEPGNKEMRFNEEPGNGEVTVSEEPSSAEANVSKEPSSAETRVSEEPSIAEANVSEKPGNLETRVSQESSIAETSVSNTVLDNHTNNLDDENEKIDRVDTEINNSDNYKNKEIDISLENTENENETAVELENVSVNGINHDTSTEVEKSDSNEHKTEENKQKKESPIKHSIDNLIGESDGNPDKYIKEVISSIEDIIMNNSKNEVRNDQNEENEMNDRNLMDALSEQIGEKRISDNDKITLEDLLPQTNRHEELENISDDDFNFDD